MRYLVLLASVCVTMTTTSGCDRLDSKTLELAKKHYAIPRNLNHIDSLTIKTREAADDLIPRLHRMPDLVDLGTSEVVLRDEELEVIGKLSQLTRLDIRNGEISDDDLSHFTDLTNLTHLHLHKNPIEGNGLKHLIGLEKLELLDLANTHVSGPSIEKLQALPHLRELRLGMTPLNDEGMSHVAQLPHLRRLSFSKTQVTEEGFMKLVNCYWLVQIGFPDDMVGPDDDLPARRQAKRNAMIRFREARLKALQEARARGENVPDDDFIPYRHVTPDHFLGDPPVTE